MPASQIITLGIGPESSIGVFITTGLGDYGGIFVYVAGSDALAMGGITGIDALILGSVTGSYAIVGGVTGTNAIVSGVAGSNAIVGGVAGTDAQRTS